MCGALAGVRRLVVLEDQLRQGCVGQRLAALLLERLLGGDFLPPALLQQMRTPHRLGGPLAGRPWVAPGYGLGLMLGPEAGGLYLSGHSGSGPGSVIAVYRGATASCAAFLEEGAEGTVEAEVVRQLRSIDDARR